MNNLFQRFVDTARLDIFDLCYMDSRQGMAGAHANVPRWTQRSAWLRVVIFITRILQSISRRGRRPWFGAPGRVLFFYFSANQQVCMAPITRRIPGSIVACADVFNHHHRERDLDFPLLLAYLSAIPMLPLVLVHLFRSSGYRRRSFRRSLDTYWFTYGFYFVAVWWLHRLRPAALVVANDHSMWTRAATHAARRLGIKTIYIQHACVSDSFPPLGFDYALLDGQDALNKYLAAGPTATQIYLVGMPKFDAYAQAINQKANASAVGLCLNKHDPFGRVREVCEVLRGFETPLRVVMRPHPGDHRSAQWSDMAKQYGFELSDPSEQGPFEFLGRVDVAVAGESSILLEAALLNVTPIYYDFPQLGKDWYGFSRNGLAVRIETAEQLNDKIQGLTSHKPDVRGLAKTYCVTVGTALEGHSAELAVGVIEGVASNGGRKEQGWERLTQNREVQAYKPVAVTAPGFVSKLV